MDYFRVIPNSFIGLRKKKRNISERNVATSDYALGKKNIHISLVFGENWSNFPGLYGQ